MSPVPGNERGAPVPSASPGRKSHHHAGQGTFCKTPGLDPSHQVTGEKRKRGLKRYRINSVHGTHSPRLDAGPKRMLWGSGRS